MKFLLRPVFHALKNDRGHFLLLLAIGLTVVALVAFTDETKWWTLFLDPVIGLGTFVFAIAVWYGELTQDWEQKLPKRLTVRFLYEGKLVMICKNAVLVSEADIRQWGQQIGKQMNDNNNLSFEPFFEIKNGRPAQKADDGFFKPYFLVYSLSALPGSKGIRQQFENGQYLHWEQLRGGGKHEQWLPHPPTLPPIDQNDAL